MALPATKIAGIIQTNSLKTAFLNFYVSIIIGCSLIMFASRVPLGLALVFHWGTKTGARQNQTYHMNVIKVLTYFKVRSQVVGDSRIRERNFFQFKTVVWIMGRKERTATTAPSRHPFWYYCPWSVISTFMCRA